MARIATAQARATASSAEPALLDARAGRIASAEDGVFRPNWTVLAFASVVSWGVVLGVGHGVGVLVRQLV